MSTKQYEVHIQNEIFPEDSSLAVVDFPAMKSQFDNEPDRIQVSVKPKSLKFQLEVDIDACSKSYCEQKAEALARVSKPQAFPRKVVDRNIYVSSKTTLDDMPLYVCRITNNKLICRPVSYLLTMRSDLSYFDLKDEVDPREEVKPVSMKFAAADKQNAPNKHKAHEEAEGLAEDFKPIYFRSMNSRETITQRNVLFGKSTRIKSDPDDIPTSPERKPNVEIVQDVKPKIERMDVEESYSSLKQNPPNSSRVANIIRHKVRECLLKARLVSAWEVYEYLKGCRELTSKEITQLNFKDINDSLNECGVIVQGNWATKTEILYGDSGERDSTDVTGISINLFTAARDYLLWLFNQTRIVSRPEFSKKVKIPDHDVLELFNQLAVFKKDTKQWELKLPTDIKYIEEFPEVVQRQTTFWKVRRANKLSIFK